MQPPAQNEAPPLSDAIQRILSGIDDSALRSQLEQVVRLALSALSEIGRIHLPQEDLGVDESSRQANKHLELAPVVLGAVTSINNLLAYMAATFPAPEEHTEIGGGDEGDDFDFDFDFDLADDGGGGGGGGNSGNSGSSAGPQAAKTPFEKVSEAANAFGSMLRSRTTTFGQRLQHAVGQQDGWPILAEVDDNKHRLMKSVQGLLFGVIGEFATGVPREEILPEYRSGVSQATGLRAAVTELTFHIGRFNEALGKADADTVVPLVVGISDRLTTFSTKPEYRSLRAEDKKAVIDFRRALHGMRHSPDGVPMGGLKRAVEGFSKFLEAMQAINQREVLVIHDRQKLELALAALEGVEQMVAADNHTLASQGLKGIVDGLQMVYGRNPELDEVLRGYKQGKRAGESLAAETQRWRQVLEGSLMTV